MAAGDASNSCTAAELQLDSQRPLCVDSHKADVSDVIPKQELQTSECQAAVPDAEILPAARGFWEHYPTPEVLSANAPQTDATDCEVGLADTYLSPSAESCDNISFAPPEIGDLPHSIVYQNEEGKWVTDLAYYTSFDEEQDINLSEDNKINDDFIT
ncbi:CE192 protein, partial [Centropus unirufus]|nr:CE192 protein [Centropus unirufus]